MTPLVLIPGMMCDARMWGGVAEALGPIHQALPVTGETVAAMAAAILASAPERFALAGLSMGGIVAMQMLHQAPGRIARLLATERLILEPARAEGFDFAAFERAWAAFEKART